MSFETKYILSQITGSYTQGNYGVQADSLGKISDERAQEIEREKFPWLNSYTSVQGETNGTTRPNMWTDGDTFLRTKLGTNISYEEQKIDSSGDYKITKTIGRYSSPLVQSLLQRQNKMLLSEQYLMSNVDVVSESLDLRATGISSLPKLKEVGGNLTLDTTSRLKALSELQKINGRLTVVAKDKEDMNNYLKMLGINDENNNPKIPIKKGVELVMKNYI